MQNILHFIIQSQQELTEETHFTQRNK